MLLTKLILIGVVRRAAVIPLLLALFSNTSFAQPRQLSSIPPGTSAIGGVVTDVLSKQPIKGCSVTLSHLVNSRPASGGVAISGVDGTYSFSDIVNGDYALMAACDGYLPSCYRNPGTEAPRCDTVSVVVDQRKSNTDFNFEPGANARGRVVDTNGRPIREATVRLGMPWHDRPFVMYKPALTDRDGRFELSTLPSGEWRLEVELPPAADSLRPPIVYFPGVLDQSEAGAIELVAGKTIDDVIVVVPPLADNILTVRLVTTETIPKVDVSLVRVEPLASRRIAMDAEGTGTVNGIAPGRYFLTARGYSSNRISAAYDAVDFVGEAQEVLLYMQPSARLTGQIIGERGAAPSLDGVRVGAAWFHDGVEINPLSVDEAAVAADGSFQFEGLFGTRQLRLFGLDPAFEVRAVMQGRTDVTAGVALTAGAEAKVVIVVGRR